MVSAEIKKGTEQENENMRFSVKLLENPINVGPGHDKVFAIASSMEFNDKDRIAIINISSSEPTVALNERYRESLGIPDSYIISDLRKENAEKKLFSGGSWVWIEDTSGKKGLILLKRDKGAPVDADCYTGPAGRCGEYPSVTSVDETNEELIMIQNGNSIASLGFYRNEEDIPRVKDIKYRQVHSVYNALLMSYNISGNLQHQKDANLLASYIKGPQDIELVKIENIITSNKSGLDTILTMVDGKLKDTVKGNYFWDQRNNTLEIREEIVYKLPKGYEILKILDGEVFLREATVVPEEDIALLFNEKLVPALQDYVGKILAYKRTQEKQRNNLP
jgi:hypothetical protein